MGLGSQAAVALGRLAAVASIRSLAWEPPYATSAALKSKKKKRELQKALVYVYCLLILEIKLNI